MSNSAPRVQESLASSTRRSRRATYTWSVRSAAARSNVETTAPPRPSGATSVRQTEAGIQWKPRIGMPARPMFRTVAMTPSISASRPGNPSMASE